MTIARQVWARQQAVGGPLEKLVLMFIADDGGGGSASLAAAGRWAAEARASTADVLAACEALRRAGLVTIVDGRIEVVAPA